MSLPAVDLLSIKQWFSYCSTIGSRLAVDIHLEVDDGEAVRTVRPCRCSASIDVDPGAFIGLRRARR